MPRYGIDINTSFVKRLDIAKKFYGRNLMKVDDLKRFFHDDEIFALKRSGALKIGIKKRNFNLYRFGD
jgi:hypothetical protein